jgi:benzoyl-CoA 2,3-dioxygenase component B
MGQDAWQSKCPVSSATPAPLIVTQATPSPRASSSSACSAHLPQSLYDLRNLFQVNVEEGRHLWAMVYLLHTYFGRDGREEAEELLRAPQRQPRQAAHPRAFNEPCKDWLSFFCFTMFTDRDGKYQLLALAEIGLRPARAHHALHADRRSAPHVRRARRASAA